MASRYYFVAIIVVVVFLVLVLCYFMWRHWAVKRRAQRRNERLKQKTNEMVDNWQNVTRQQTREQQERRNYNEPLTRIISSDLLPPYNMHTMSDGFTRPYSFYSDGDLGMRVPRDCLVCRRAFHDDDVVRQVYGGLAHLGC